MRLENKNAIITGATGGIGFATVSKYLDEGANVMMVGRSEDKLVEVNNRLGKPNNAAFCVADSTDEIAIKDSVQKLMILLVQLISLLQTLELKESYNR